jgi:hypothetical protein
MAGFPLDLGFGLDILPFRSGIRTIATENGESAACCIANGVPLQAFLAGEQHSLMHGRLMFRRCEVDVEVILNGKTIGLVPMECFREAAMDAVREGKEQALKNRFVIRD